jgi:hypothetical protein
MRPAAFGLMLALAMGGTAFGQSRLIARAIELAPITLASGKILTEGAAL